MDGLSVGQWRCCWTCNHACGRTGTRTSAPCVRSALLCVCRVAPVVLMDGVPVGRRWCCWTCNHECARWRNRSLHTLLLRSKLRLCLVVDRIQWTHTSPDRSKNTDQGGHAVLSRLSYTHTHTRARTSSIHPPACGYLQTVRRGHERERERRRDGHTRSVHPCGGGGNTVYAFS